MEAEQLLEKVFSSFERYYTIKKTDITPPFTAEAEFRSHSEQYVLIKAAKIADIDSNDFVYFKIEDCLSLEKLQEFSKIAWEAGLSRVKPYYGHRNSDVTLIILADKIEEETAKMFRKIKFSKSYKFGMFGWSNFRICALEISSGRVFYNRLGKDLKKILANIKN